MVIVLAISAALAVSLLTLRFDPALLAGGGGLRRRVRHASVV